MDKTRRHAVAGASWRLFRETRRPGAPGLGARLRAIPRMVRSVMGGRYKGLSVTKLGLMALSVAYIVSPIDAIPDVLPIIGVADDTGVLIWLLSSLVMEAGDFVRWERDRGPTVVHGDVLTG